MEMMKDCEIPHSVGSTSWEDSHQASHRWCCLGEWLKIVTQYSQYAKFAFCFPMAPHICRKINLMSKGVQKKGERENLFIHICVPVSLLVYSCVLVIFKEYVMTQGQLTSLEITETIHSKLDIMKGHPECTEYQPKLEWFQWGTFSGVWSLVYLGWSHGD